MLASSCFPHQTPHHRYYSVSASVSASAPASGSEPVQPQPRQQLQHQRRPAGSCTLPSMRSPRQKRFASRFVPFAHPRAPAYPSATAYWPRQSRIAASFACCHPRQPLGCWTATSRLRLSLSSACRPQSCNHWSTWFSRWSSHPLQLLLRWNSS